MDRVFLKKGFVTLLKRSTESQMNLWMACCCSLEGLMIENGKSNGQWLVFQKYTEIQLSIYMQYEKDVKFSWANFETKV